MRLRDDGALLGVGVLRVAWRSVPAAATNRSRNAGYALSSTRMRERRGDLALIAKRRAPARLDGVVHVVGEDDVGSSAQLQRQLLNFGAATDAMELPVAVPPVNETAFTSGCPVSGGPIVAPRPCTMFRTPGAGRHRERCAPARAPSWA